MMKKELLKVAIRQNAFVLFNEWTKEEANTKINETSSVLLANCAKLGYTFSEELLHRDSRRKKETHRV